MVSLVSLLVVSVVCLCGATKPRDMRRFVPRTPAQAFGSGFGEDCLPVVEPDHRVNVIGSSWNGGVLAGLEGYAQLFVPPPESNGEPVRAQCDVGTLV